MLVNNAVKSSCGVRCFRRNRLFATLDPKLDSCPLILLVSILMTDTVGFIRKLPLTCCIVQEYLEEITEAIYFFMLWYFRVRTSKIKSCVCRKTLEDLGAGDVPTLVVFNKIDMLQDRSIFTDVVWKVPKQCVHFCRPGINILGLKDAVAQMLQRNFSLKKLYCRTQNKSYRTAVWCWWSIRKVLRRGKMKMKIRIHRRDKERFMQMVKWFL